jgi:hypothetical protein
LNLAAKKDKEAQHNRQCARRCREARFRGVTVLCQDLARAVTAVSQANQAFTCVVAESQLQGIDIELLMAAAFERYLARQLPTY